MALITVTDHDGRTHQIQAEAGQSLMRVLTDEGLDIPALCGGSRACATCHVHVAADWVDRLPAQDEGELGLVSEEPSFIAGQSRLSCQIPVTEDLDGLCLSLAPAD